ncbi:MAG: adenylate/guanylate cyclase domain-containing protein [Pseudomonadota bacterium]
MERRLAAILAADVVGFTRMTEADEEGTLARLQEVRRDVVDPLIADYRGRVVKLMGDGALIEFGSVVDAVRCAAQIQRSVAAHGIAEAPARRLTFRMGINVGDVIVDGDDIYGDGVNLAARLEALADAGSVLVSERVFEQVERSAGVGFRDLGPKTFKNVAKPIKVYRVLQDGEVADDAPRPAADAPHRFGRFALAAVALAVVIALGAGALFSSPPESEAAFEPADPDRAAFPLPVQPSVVVVPFRSVADELEQKALADGLTDAVTGALARVPGILLIDREAPEGGDDDRSGINDAAETVGAFYVLKGSVQRSEDLLRVQAQLANASTGEVVWAEDYDQPFGDPLAVQDDVTREVVTELEVHLSEGEQARIRKHQTESLDAYVAFNKGLQALDSFSADGQVEAQGAFEQALELDPAFVSARALLGHSYVEQARNGWVADVDAARRTGETHVAEALERDPENVDALGARANVLMDRQEHDAAIATLRKAAEIAPNHVDNLTWLALFLAMTGGDPNEVEAIADRIMRISPNYPNELLSALAVTHYVAGDHRTAIDLAETRHHLTPEAEIPLVHLVFMYQKAGRHGQASEALERLLRIRPDYTIDVFSRRFEPWFEAAVFADIVEQALAAGVPDDRTPS